MSAALWREVLDLATGAARLRRSPAHGEGHWRAVSALGMALHRHDPRVDPAVMLAFGMLHDCRREAEHDDPGHGPRAALVAQASEALLALLGDTRRSHVVHACRVHTAARALDPARGASAAACLDADRFTLGRVGIDPSPRFFSLYYEAAAFRRWLAEAGRLSREAPGWDALIATALAHPAAADGGVSESADP